MLDARSEAEVVVDVAFPLQGKTLPLDHGYALFAALSRVIPLLHAAPSWGIHPVRGHRSGPGVLEMEASSFLKFRMPANRIADVLSLPGKMLTIDGHRVTPGIPRVFPLEPRAALKARFVTVKNAVGEPAQVEKVLRMQLAAIPNLGEDPERISIVVGARRVMRIAGKDVVGFAASLDGLETQASLAVQTHGIGGRRHMGAGIFVPYGRTA